MAGFAGIGAFGYGLGSPYTPMQSRRPMVNMYQPFTRPQKQPKVPVDPTEPAPAPAAPAAPAPAPTPQAAAVVPPTPPPIAAHPELLLTQKNSLGLPATGAATSAMDPQLQAIMAMNPAAFQALVAKLFGLA